MRIIYLHQYFRTPEMNGGTRSYEMARRLVRKGHEVHMVTAETDGRLAGRDWVRTEEAGIHVHWLPVPYSNKMSYSERISAFRRFAWAASRRAASLPGDVVLATSTPLTIALPAVWASRRQRAPMVFEVRDLWPELPIAVGALQHPLTIAAARWLERFAYGHADRVIALSPGMRDGVVATGYPAERVATIPNSCDLELFRAPADAGADFRSRHAWLGDRPLVVYTGTLGRINDVGYMARLAAAVAPIAPEVRFLVLGEGYEEPKIREQARDLGVLDRSFFMLPSVPKREMPGVLAAATMATSLFCDLPSMWANSANKFFDALAAGRPVAINYGGWQAEMIRESGCGLVLSPMDVDAAATALAAALRSPDWLARAQEASGRLAEERFSRDRLAAQLEAVLLDAVADQARGTRPRLSAATR